MTSNTIKTRIANHSTSKDILIGLIAAGLLLGFVLGAIHVVADRLSPSVHERAEQLAEKLRKIEGFHLTARRAVQKYRLLNTDERDKISVDLSEAEVGGHLVIVTTNLQTVSVHFFETRLLSGICFYQGDPNQIQKGSDRHHVTTNCFTFVSM